MKRLLEPPKTVDPMTPTMEECSTHGRTLFVWSFRPKLPGGKLLHCLECWKGQDEAS